MVAILRYTDSMQDGRNVFAILARGNAKILKTFRKSKYTIRPSVVIRVDSFDELNKVLVELNESCNYEVSVDETYEYDYDYQKQCEIDNDPANTSSAFRRIIGALFHKKEEA